MSGEAAAPVLVAVTISISSLEVLCKTKRALPSVPRANSSLRTSATSRSSPTAKLVAVVTVTCSPGFGTMTIEFVRRTVSGRSG